MAGVGPRTDNEPDVQVHRALAATRYQIEADEARLVSSSWIPSC
jgi:hypothetical protein